MDDEKYLALTWPFAKDEKAVLYWLSSPIRNKVGYLVQVYFKTNDGIIKKELYPWGTLPFLSLGSTYSNAMQTPSEPSGNSGFFTANDIATTTMLKSYDAVTRGFYPLSVCESAAGYEKCQVLLHKDGRTFIFPCISIIQSLLCPSVFLANRILTSAGLDELSYSEYIDQENGFHIDFTEDYPSSSLPNRLLAHYCWLKNYKPALEAWKRVFVSLSSSNIETLFPFYGQERIKYYGPSLGKTTLVLRFEVDNLIFPFKNIYVSHPSQQNTTSPPNASRRIFRVHPEDESNIIFNSPHCASSGSQQKVENLTQDTLHFSGFPKIQRIRIEDKEKNKTQIIRDPALPAPKFTTQDTGSGRQAHPIEVNTSVPLNVQPFVSPDGLELFYAALEIIRATSPFIGIDANNYSFPAIAAFAITSTNVLRTYSVAKIGWNSNSSLYVIEMSHNSSWNLSTLVFSGAGDHHKISGKIIDCLLHNSGHWDKEQLRELGNLNIRTIKHFANRTAVRFAELILLAIQ